MEPVVPEYGGACIASVVPALLGDRRRPWMPEPVLDAAQVVLLVLDGLGWDQLQARSQWAPTMSTMAGGPITSVAPTTTSAALTSITTGRPPADHGIVGYRVHLGDGQVLNVLRWRTDEGDPPEPSAMQSLPVFNGTAPPVVSRGEFAHTGFTDAHLGGTRLHGWRTPSALVVEVKRLLRAGEPFVYAYYDGIDKIAHQYGLAEHYEAELAFADRLVADLRGVLPPGAALLVTSDHGQVDVGDNVVPVAPEVEADVAFVSGESRFRWLHAKPGTAGRLAERAKAAHGDVAWVRTRDEVAAEGWLGARLPVERLGDVVLAPFEATGFLDPADPGELRLRSRHGSLTPAEMWVPLLAG
ncbi:MAG TPA: alkaline phosphatase family protein [Acidimicrobiales bacterium]|nr:alkaline phosphatase family protein [Acidimicrobiales bacterium]